VHINLCAYYHPILSVTKRVLPNPCNLLLGKGPLEAGAAEFDADQKQIILFGRQHCGVNILCNYTHTAI
jgi:hypothetical protein